MSGLASASGAASPEHSTPVISGISTSGLTFQLTASTTAQYLASAWVVATAYTAGQVVVCQGRIYRCTTGGTSAASGNGPATTGAAVTDGTVTWRGVGPFVNGFKITNADASIRVYWTIGEGATTTTGDAIAPGTAVGMSVADPSRISVVAASGTPLLTISGLS